MEHRRTDAHEGSSDKNGEVGGSHGKGQQTNHGDAHANRERVRLRPAVGVEPHDRLKQRSGQLQREGDPPNLSVIQMEAGFQQRINRRNQRLHRVIQQMTEADGEKNRKNGFRGGFRASCGPRPRFDGVQIRAAGHLRLELAKHLCAIWTHASYLAAEAWRRVT